MKALLQAGGGQGWLSFSDPVEMVAASRLSDVLPSLQYIESEVDGRGLTAVGFIAYEAAPAFDAAFKVISSPDAPLLRFGLFEEGKATNLGRCGSTDFHVGVWRPTVAEANYLNAIERIKSLISLGQTYQVNYTFALEAEFSGDSLAYFQRLVAAQRPEHAAYLDFGDQVICSASPELFLTLDGPILESRPMKGTASRAASSAGDREQAALLRSSAKNRAENVMIVDMIRNDMGRVADVGTVDVPALFQVERHPTLWQMTSTVRSRTSSTFVDIMRALFPCSSITGAPKVSTMTIIGELETHSRGIYTGAIGMLQPERKAHFNVAIRTVAIDRLTSRASYGVGSGVVWDSDGGQEYAECLLKAQVLDHQPVNFELLESILWTADEGYLLLERHLGRLAASADYFGFRLNLLKAHALLMEYADALAVEKAKVRLLVSEDGSLTLNHEPVGSYDPVDVVLAGQPVDSADPFLNHKTTSRTVYERAMGDARGAGDVVLYNEAGLLTETTTSNLVLDIGGQLVTPPLSSGLLAGTLRAELVHLGIVTEVALRPVDLLECDQIYLINSVRGWRKAKLAGEDAAHIRKLSEVGWSESPPGADMR